MADVPAEYVKRSTAAAERAVRTAGRMRQNGCGRGAGRHGCERENKRKSGDQKSHRKTPLIVDGDAGTHSHKKTAPKNNFGATSMRVSCIGKRVTRALRPMFSVSSFQESPREAANHAG